MSLWSERCFMAASWQSQHLSLKKKQKNGKKWDRNGPWSDPIAFKSISDQTQVRSMRLWSDPIALEVASDQTKARSKRLWSDPIALEVASDQTKMRSKRLWSDPIALEVGSDQTKVRSKRLWSDPIALEVASDQTQVHSNPPMIRLFRPKWPLIRLSPEHGPDRSALELPKRPCNFALGTHGCTLDWFWS